MTFPTWPNVTYVYVSDEDYATVEKVVQAIDAVIPPEIPPEVWQEKPVDGEKAIRAMRAMCRGQ